jgi:GNAT superfamily N-acetyltransferase
MEKLKNQKEKGTQVIKRPGLCTADELRNFHGLVLSGGQVTRERLPELIRRAILLGFHYVGPKLVGVAGLKVPRESYKNRIFREAGLEHLSEDFHTELGWAVTCKEFEGTGVASNLIQKLLEQMKKEKIFSTTTSDKRSMQHILTKFGFTQAGRSYVGPETKSSALQIWLRDRK